MRLLVATLSLLVLAVAHAHHEPSHKLKYPEFIEKKTHLYEMTINVTSGVPGLHPQLSKSVINMEVEIYAKSKSEIVLMAHRVLVSNSLPGVGSDTDPVTLTKNAKLEEKLKIPITAVYESGVIKRFTLGHSESLESAKIKRTILRNFELYLDQSALTGNTKEWSPITYNHTKSTPLGNYSSHYVINSSPYSYFPIEKNVYNISRSDNYEVLPYLAYKSHHNFVQQGCPDVCNKDHVENPFGAGCPTQLEPHNTPLKKSFYQKHNIRTVKTGESIFDIIRTTETHTADLYDQNMEIVLTSLIKFKRTVSKPIVAIDGQTSYTDLNDWSVEISEKEISDLCGYPDPREAVNAVKKLLDEITSTVVEGKIENPKTKHLGYEIIMLQKALGVLKEGDLRTVQKSIVSYDELPSSSETEKVKRQIWIDSLSLIGTKESVSFIVQLIRENMNKPNKAISLWESISILEALPMNIQEPTEKTVIELSSLLEIITEKSTPGYTMFYSASHLAVSRVISILCSVSTGVQDVEEMSAPRNRLNGGFYRKVCPKTIVKKFISDVTEKLKSTTNKTKRVIYIHTLATTGVYEVLKVLKPYVNGHIEGLSLSYIDYIRTVTMNSFYVLAPKYPKQVRDILVPLFFNKTEPPKIRTTAFGVILKSQPTLGLFQHIVEETWREPSEEVGSFVTTTMETYGNSSIPCHQLTARRIKKVLPQMKRIVPGKHHAQNNLWTMFDSIRGFGAEQHISITPSNETFVPSNIFLSLGAHIDSFKEILLQLSVNSQGLTSRNVWDSFLKTLKLSPAEDIPKSKESEIFPDIDIIPRDPEFWRVTLYEKLFYSSSYYYYDAEETNRHEILEIVKDQISHYFKFDKHGNMEGHVVRLIIPSSYHSKAIGHTMPSPVELEMRNILLASLKVKTDITKSSSGGASYSVDVSPSFYYSNLYSNQFLNLGDCKDVGVYHEKKMAMTYPFRVSLNVDKSTEISISYTFPELPKTVFTWESEAGTYAGKKKLIGLPSMEDKRTYKIIPSQFKRTDTFGVKGLPLFASQIFTEDIQSGYEDIPRDHKESFNQFIKDFFNAGWRRKSVIIKRIPDSVMWTTNTKIDVFFNFVRDYVTPKSDVSDQDWTKGLIFDDELKAKDVSTYSAEGQIITKKFVSLPHIMDKASFKVKQTSHGKSVATGFFDVTYRHTYGGYLHLVHFNASCTIPKVKRGISMSASYALAFSNRPNEFNYKEDTFGNQRGIAIGSISFPKLPPFTSPTIITKGIFYYKPLEEVLKRKMSPPPTHEHFLPETHAECLKDVSSGKSQSVACIKAVREFAIFNRFRGHAIWDKELPFPVISAAHQFDLALKHAYYTHMTSHKIHTRPHSAKEVHVHAYYINKMTDEPVIDIAIFKPTEILKFHRVSTGSIEPLSSVDSIYDTYTAKYTNNSYPVTCALMGNFVRTYDLKTFKLPREDMPTCSYILSTHCTTHKKFAVLVKIDPQVPGTREIHVYLGSEEYVFIPGTTTGYKVKYNGKEETVTLNHPVMFNEKAVIYASMHTAADKTTYLEFYAEDAGIRIVYDGKNVKTQVHPRYKGELCGLCSEFNGEKVREMRGVDNCLYSHSSDFVKSAMVGTCAQRDSNYPKICSDNDVTFSDLTPRNGEDEGQEPTVKRNLVLQNEDKFCFSVKSWPVCESTSPIQTETQDVGFHCLPKTDKEARRLIKEAKRRILGEMETKAVHKRESVEVASKC